VPSASQSSGGAPQARSDRQNGARTPSRKNRRKSTIFVTFIRRPGPPLPASPRPKRHPCLVRKPIPHDADRSGSGLRPADKDNWSENSTSPSKTIPSKTSARKNIAAQSQNSPCAPIRPIIPILPIACPTGPKTQLHRPKQFLRKRPLEKTSPRSLKIHPTALLFVLVPKLSETLSLSKRHLGMNRGANLRGGGFFVHSRKDAVHRQHLRA
jgi:hypothetical protein